MKILFWQWHSFMNRGIETAFQKLNVEYDILFYQQTDWEKNDGIVETLEQKLATQAYDLVFSVNFAPLVAEGSMGFYMCRGFMMLRFTSGIWRH